MRAVVLFIGLLGCGTSLPRSAWHERAAIDLRCSIDHVQVDRNGDDRRVARGCGRVATYVRVCTAPRACRWVPPFATGLRELERRIEELKQRIWRTRPRLRHLDERVVATRGT